MVALTPSPSPFATLLRRSKFATFDPRIAQVFTTHGGDAHRGNWGLKRPIALRRRGAHITVKAIDTSAQQTEWNSGENQAKFALRYGELNIEPKRFDTHQHFDSEFAPGEAPGVKLPPLTANPLKLRPSQFRTYLEQLRAKRPAFIEYVRKMGVTKPMHQLRPSHDLHARFILDETVKASGSLESRAMDRSIHKSGGLIYSRPSLLQTYLTTKPQPGRILMDAIKYHGRQEDGYIVGFAGMTSILWKSNAVGNIKRMKWGGVPDPENGVA